MSEATQEFVKALEALMEGFQKGQRGLFKDWKLTPVQFFVLRYVSRDPGANMSQLAEFLGVRPQTMTPIVDALEKGGWVRRTRSADDRRASLLQLTPRGTRLLESVRASFIDSLGRALEDAPVKSLEMSAEMLRLAAAAMARERAPATPSH